MEPQPQLISTRVVDDAPDAGIHSSARIDLQKRQQSDSLPARKRRVIRAFAVPLVLASVITSSGCSLCETSEQTRVASPDGRYTAFVLVMSVVRQSVTRNR